MVVYGVELGADGHLAAAVLRNGRLEGLSSVSPAGTSRSAEARELDPVFFVSLIKGWRSEHGVDSELMVVGHASLGRSGDRVSAYSSGFSLGTVAAAASALGIRVLVSPPQTWRRAFSLPRGRLYALSAASDHFPDWAVELSAPGSRGKPEAALLALYGFSKA